MLFIFLTTFKLITFCLNLLQICDRIMKYNEFYFQNTNFYFVIGFPGSGKTHVMNDISYNFDLQKLESNFPCIFDNIRLIYRKK